MLTGGGSQIPGLDEVAAHILGRQVRLGRPLRIPGLPQADTGPAFASAVGWRLFAANPQDEWWDFEMPATAIRRGRKRAIQWFRDNWCVKTGCKPREIARAMHRLIRPWFSDDLAQSGATGTGSAQHQE